MKYIDTHCHLDSIDFDIDREEILERMKSLDMGAITIGADLESSRKAIEIAKQNDKIWACVGMHPEHITIDHLDLTESDGAIFELEKLITDPKVVAIGECGLDYFRLANQEQKKLQKKLFESQIDLALKYKKPLMLHIREAYDDALYILEDYKKQSGEKLRGNVHFFAGNTEIAKKFLNLGFTLSFTGVVTFARDYDEVIKYIPQAAIMSETDAPWVAPIPFRGKRNEPAYVIEVVKKLAEIRGENVDELNNAIVANAKRVFLI